MSGRRNSFRSCRTRNALPLVQTPIRRISSINRLRERAANQDRSNRGRFIRTARSRNLFATPTPVSSPISTPINPVRLILRFNNVSSYSPISNTNMSPVIDPVNNIIETPSHRAVSNLELFGLQDESPVIDSIRFPISTFDLDREIININTNLFESDYVYDHLRLNDLDLDNFDDLSL